MKVSTYHDPILVEWEKVCDAFPKESKQYPSKRLVLNEARGLLRRRTYARTHHTYLHRSPPRITPETMLDIAKPLYTSLQVDETAIGARKYHRGARL